MKCISEIFYCSDFLKINLKMETKKKLYKNIAGRVLG
jgi:hypothetical protein